MDDFAGCPVDNSHARDIHSSGGGFRAFTRADWERIESVPVQLRRVGQMMKNEAAWLTSRKGTGIQKHLHINPRPYAAICADLRLTTGVQDSCEAPYGSSKKLQTKNKKKERECKPGAREQAEMRTRAQDCAKIRGLNFRCPRWDYADTKPEVYIVAFRLWLVGSPECAHTDEEKLDRLVSYHSLLSTIEDKDIIADIESDMEATLRGFTFERALNCAANSEHILASPSFQASFLSLDLHQEQKQVASILLASLSERLEAIVAGAPPPTLLMRFCTPPSTGKSSAAAYLGALCLEFRRQPQKIRRHLTENSYVIYECYSESVRFDVAKMCVAASIPFAIMSDRIASPSFSCYHQKHPKHKPVPVDPGEHIAYSLHIMDLCDCRPAVLICDPASTIALLQHRAFENPDSVGDILLLDEPTASFNDSVTRAHASILSHAPAMTVLMSATCPALDSFKRTIGNIALRYPGELRTVTVSSSRIASPCTIVDAKGSVYAPHQVYRGSCGELVQLVTDNLHIRRLYSPRAVRLLLGDVPTSESDARTYISGLLVNDCRSFESIRTVGVRILTMCDPSLYLCQDIRARYQEVNGGLVCTTDAHLLPGVSIIMSSDSDIFRTESLLPLASEGGRLDKRLQRVAAQEAKASRARVHESVAHKREGKREQGDQISRAREATRQAEAIEISPIWPAELCINSAEHRQRFAPSSKLCPEFFKCTPIVPDDILNQSCEALVVGMLCGFCTLHSSSGDRASSIASLNLAESKSFSIISGDRSAIFGVNLPCDRVVILFKPRELSNEEMVQCMGRCGRTGKYARSEVMFGSLDLLESVLDIDRIPRELADSSSNVLDALVSAFGVV